MDFTSGHASSSVSIALGMARARTLSGGDYNVVTVIGDGAATGGMAYEGMNDAAVSGEPMVVILNDNAMSIDRNVGGMAKHLSRLRTKEKYLGMKRKYPTYLEESCMLFDEIAVSAGERGHQMIVNTQGLVDLTGATLQDLIA